MTVALDPLAGTLESEINRKKYGKAVLKGSRCMVDTITAFPETGTAAIEITVGEEKVTNGGKATWNSGANTVKVKVTDGALTKTYTVTVTKE